MMNPVHLIALIYMWTSQLRADDHLNIWLCPDINFCSIFPDNKCLNIDGHSHCVHVNVTKRNDLQITLEVDNIATKKEKESPVLMIKVNGWQEENLNLRCYDGHNLIKEGKQSSEIDDSFIDTIINVDHQNHKRICSWMVFSKKQFDDNILEDPIFGLNSQQLRGKSY